MAEQDLLRALPLICGGWDPVGLELPLVEVRDCIYNDPGNTATKVDNLRGVLEGKERRGEERDLVKKETHETSRDDWVANPNVPSSP